MASLESGWCCLAGTGGPNSSQSNLWAVKPTSANSSSWIHCMPFLCRSLGIVHMTRALCMTGLTFTSDHRCDDGHNTADCAFRRQAIEDGLCMSQGLPSCKLELLSRRPGAPRFGDEEKWVGSSRILPGSHRHEARPFVEQVKLSERVRCKHPKFLL